MIATVEIDKNTGETNASLIRRFSRKLQETKTLAQARGLRYRVRPLSEFKKKKRALKRLERQRLYERKRKLGKM